MPLECAFAGSDGHTCSLLDSVTENVCAIDRTGRIVAVNKVWEVFAQVNGMTSIDSVSVGANYLMVCERAVAEGDRDAIEPWNGIQAVLQGQRSQFYTEYPCHSVDDERWFFMQVLPWQRPEGGAVISHRNITDMRLAQREVLHLRERMAQKDRESVSETLMAAITHEINQPLTAIQCNTHACMRLLEQPTGDQSELCDAVHDISRATKRVTEVLHSMRMVFSRTVLKPERFDIGTALSGMAALLQDEILTHGITLARDIDPGAPLVWGERVAIEQVIANLLRNAIDAVKTQAADQRRVTVTAKVQKDNSLCIAVTDSGPGIDPTVHASIFEPFFTTKSNNVGMGLAICRRIVHKHGGQLKATNLPDGGAHLSFTIPDTEFSPLSH